MPAPFFSVVIPLYNKAKHIGGAMESVLAQTFTDFELVVVDDGSTDNSLMIAENASSDAKVCIISQENRGVSIARNRGVEEASGKYIAFLDADDSWTPVHLAELARLIASYPGKGLYSCAHAIIRNGKRYYRRQPPSEDFVADAPGFFTEYARSFAIVNSSTACVPKDVLAKIGGFPEKIKRGEDVIVWIQAVLVGGVAYSSLLGAVTNEDAENRSDQYYSHEIPFFVSWLDSQLREGRIFAEAAEPARKFLYRAALFNAAGCAMRGDMSCLKLYDELGIAKSSTLRILLWVLTILPKNILRISQKIRHKKLKYFFGL